jgi:serine/threonine-protein kinase
MEYVEGYTLKQMLSRGPVPMKQIVKIGADMSAALQAAHEQGVIHRDIKPANVMVTNRGEVKVMDFGLALRPERVVHTLGPNTYGTVQYMSPEQVAGKELEGHLALEGIILRQVDLAHAAAAQQFEDLEMFERLGTHLTPPPSTLVPEFPGSKGLWADV